MLSQACARAETCYICEQKSNGPPKDADGEEKVRGIRESRTTLYHRCVYEQDSYFG